MESTRQFEAGSVRMGGAAALFVIAGPCVIESETHAMRMARALADVCARVGVPLIFKASFDKANRSSLDSFRGPGLAEGLRILGTIKATTGLPVMTDIHEPA